MSCDSLLLENESLKKEIVCLSKDLAQYFGSHVWFNHIWKKNSPWRKMGLVTCPKKEKRLPFLRTKIL
jgi:hypothetical protein